MSHNDTHLTAAEAVGKLDKIRWANTEPDDRLRILEKIQAKVQEELEDLGVEEAEMKNMNLGTMDNLYAPDACRLTAVVPTAFAISAAIDLYKANIARKQLYPVKQKKVEQNGGVDMIDFGAGTPDVSRTDEEKLEGGEEEEIKAAVEEEENTAASPGMTTKEKTVDVATKENGASGETKEREETKENGGGDVPPEEEEKKRVNGDQEASSPSPENPPSEPTSEPPSEPPTEPPPVPPSEPPPVAPSDAPPEPPSDPPPVPPSEPPPEPPSDPPPPVPTPQNGENNNDDNQKNNNENGGDDMASSSMDVTETSVISESQLKDVDMDDSVTKPPAPAPTPTPATANDKEVPTNAKKATAPTPPKAEKIKITFDADDEFANLDPDVDPNELLFHDMLVSPRTWNEKGYFNGRQERLRVQGDPEHRVGPYDRRDPQATAILGASSYSSAAEVIKATFLDGHVVVYKPHPYNADVDKIWAEIMKPLVQVGAVSYCQADQGPELIQDDRIDQIYMTGSEETAHEIRKLTTKNFVVQTGSVNPVILVPSLDRPWKPKEVRHHALQIASSGKFNGGHFCGRPQVIITSKEWDQRDQFLEELEKAIRDRTPPEGSYDPKYRKQFERFVQEYPDGQIIEPEDLETDSARVLLVKGAAHDSYGLQHEAFCQVLIEVTLDLPDHPVAFLPDAVKFCNEKLYGSLCATIVIDDVTNKQYSGIVHQGLTDLRYGTVSTNAMAFFGWINPSLYWGGYKLDKEEDDAKAKGVGHFGNLMGYENAIKSVITDSFCGSGHFIKTCRGAFAEKMASLSHYAIEPTMKKVTAYKYKGVRAAAARKDW